VSGWASPNGFLPTWVAEVELGAPVDDIVAPPRTGGPAYGRARALARLHGQPLGFVDVPLVGGRVSASVIVADVRDKLAEPLDLHLAGDRIDDALTVAGLPSPEEPPCSAPGPYGEREPFVSVVVPTRERGSLLKRCLEALLSLDYPAYEVVVVDSEPRTDATIELAFGTGDPRVRYFVEPVRGTSRARNRAVNEARGDLLAFTDDDVIVDRGWLRGLVRGFTRAPEVGCVTGFVATAELDSESQLLFDRRVSWGRSFESRLYDLENNEVDDPLYPYIAGVFGTGASFAASRRALENLGGFDEALGPGTPPRGGEDLDLFLRVILAGKTIAYEPGALAWHLHRRGEQALRRQLFGYGSGLTAYAFKHMLASRTGRDVIERVPGGLRRLVHLEPASRSRALAPSLRVIELAGACTGPVAYLLGRRRAVRRKTAASV
jgi:GT2 family glycosyltransferase